MFGRFEFFFFFGLTYHSDSRVLRAKDKRGHESTAEGCIDRTGASRIIEKRSKGDLGH